jgi:acyl phosphate:glycerol-3-phosphate acyltransferase
MLIPFLVVGAVAYLLGSIPFGLLVVRLFRKQDIRQSGSGNIGATNVLRYGGKGLGADLRQCCWRMPWRDIFISRRM